MKDPNHRVFVYFFEFDYIWEWLKTHHPLWENAYQPLISFFMFKELSSFSCKQAAIPQIINGMIKNMNMNATK